MPKIAPMLKVLGYDPYDRYPKYGEPDDFVLSKVSRIRSTVLTDSLLFLKH